MTPLAIIDDETQGDRASGLDRKRMRCAPVGDHLSLAVIKLDQPCQTSEPTLSASLRAIAGVGEVHIDSTRRTIQVLYDGELGTAESVLRLLVSAGRKTPPVVRQGKHGRDWTGQHGS